MNLNVHTDIIIIDKNVEERTYEFPVSFTCDDIATYLKFSTEVKIPESPVFFIKGEMTRLVNMNSENRIRYYVENGDATIIITGESIQFFFYMPDKMVICQNLSPKYTSHEAVCSICDEIGFKTPEYYCLAAQDMKNHQYYTRNSLLVEAALKSTSINVRRQFWDETVTNFTEKNIYEISFIYAQALEYLSDPRVERHLDIFRLLAIKAVIDFVGNIDKAKKEFKNPKTKEMYFHPLVMKSWTNAHKMWNYFRNYSKMSAIDLKKEFITQIMVNKILFAPLFKISLENHKKGYFLVLVPHELVIVKPNQWSIVKEFRASSIAKMRCEDNGIRIFYFVFTDSTDINSERELENTFIAANSPRSIIQYYSEFLIFSSGILKKDKQQLHKSVKKTIEREERLIPKIPRPTSFTPIQTTIKKVPKEEYFEVRDEAPYVLSEPPMEHNTFSISALSLLEGIIGHNSLSPLDDITQFLEANCSPELCALFSQIPNSSLPEYVAAAGRIISIHAVQKLSPNIAISLLTKLTHICFSLLKGKYRSFKHAFISILSKNDDESKMMIPLLSTIALALQLSSALLSYTRSVFALDILFIDSLVRRFSGSESLESLKSILESLQQNSNILAIFKTGIFFNEIQPETEYEYILLYERARLLSFLLQNIPEKLCIANNLANDAATMYRFVVSFKDLSHFEVTNQFWKSYKNAILVVESVLNKNIMIWTRNYALNALDVLSNCGYSEETIDNLMEITSMDEAAKIKLINDTSNDIGRALISDTNMAVSKFVTFSVAILSLSNQSQLEKITEILYSSLDTLIDFNAGKKNSYASVIAGIDKIKSLL